MKPIMFSYVSYDCAERPEVGGVVEVCRRARTTVSMIRSKVISGSRKAIRKLLLIKTVS
jgi:hypothetical protein